MTPETLGKLQGAVQKIEDAKEKLCECALDPIDLTSHERLICHRAANECGQTQTTITSIYPVEPPP